MRAAWLRMEQMRQLLNVETVHTSKPADLAKRLATDLEIPSNEPTPFQQLAARAKQKNPPA